MTSKARKILRGAPEVAFYLKKIIELIHPEKVILFGSKARGDSTRFSDTDFAIIAHHSIDTEAITGALDIVNYNEVSSILKEQIDTEGIVLYEKD